MDLRLNPNASFRPEVMAGDATILITIFKNGETSIS